MKKSIRRKTLSIGILAALAALLVLVSVHRGATAPVPDPIPGQIEQIVSAELEMPLEIHALDRGEAQDIERNLGRWAEGSIDMKKARVTRSARYRDRILYYQRVEQNAPRYLERGPGRGALRSAHPIDLFCHRGPGVFKFRKLLEQEAVGRIEGDEALALVRDFVVREHFVRIDEIDTFGDARHAELRRSRWTDTLRKEEDLLLLQGVKLTRRFDGCPVVNSNIAVYFHPDTREILGFRHENWSPVMRKIAPKSWKSAQGPPGSARTLEEIKDVLTRRIRTHARENEKAEVESAARAWYQTESELVPILAFCIRIEERGVREEASARRHIEYINLTGSDDIFPRRPYGAAVPDTAPRED